ncbi:MAG: methyltransferase, partial [Halieaceae bacterium]|nr:methyltransferase [Halieaceae bacterium]
MTTTRRSGGRRARMVQRESDASSDSRMGAGFLGGQYRALSDHDVNRIHEGAVHTLETVGMGILGKLPPGVQAMLDRGASLSDAGRVLIPRSMVEDTLENTCRSWILHGLDPDRSIEIAPGRVHFGTAGGAVGIRDFHTRTYRDPTLCDLYDAARLIDTLPNIHWCYRPLIARDMESVTDLDINTAYALISGTSKPWGTTLGSAESVQQVVAMFDMVLGGEGRFRETPVCHSVQGDGIPPLRFAEDRCIIRDAAIRAGLPIMVASAPQAGTTSPAALAGT